MKIREIVNLKEFDPVVNLNWAIDINEQERMLSSYIMTEKTAEIFVDILESLNLVRSESRRGKKSGDINNTVKRSHIISGQYGTGKSYFLLMLDVILEMKNPILTEKIINKFKKFPDLYFQLEYIRKEKKYFVIRINGESENEKEFKDLIQEKIIEELKKSFGEEVPLSTEYIKMIEMIEDLNLRHGDKTEKALREKNYDLDDLVASLSNYRREGLEQAKELFKEVIGFIPSIQVESLEDFFTDVNAVLKENGYNELVIVFDEFSAYLTASMENKRMNKDLGQIQTLAQLTSANSKKNISFVASIHKDISEMLEKNGISTKEELDKVLGRFDSHILSFDQGEELLKNTIETDKIVFDKYSERYHELIKQYENEYNCNFLDFYPLHPSTVKYLEPISQLYAQKVRTTFGFLQDVVKEIFFDKEIEENGKLNLITLSDLYDYFEAAIGSKNNGIIEIYNQNYNNFSKDEVLIKVLKALTIAYSSSLTKSNTNMELSAIDLKNIYQFDSEEYVREKLTPILNNNYSNITINNGKYRLFINNSGINLDKLINETKDKISSNRMLSDILSKSESRIVIKKTYKISHTMGIYPVERTLEGEIFSLKEFEESIFEETFQTCKDGKLIFVIPQFGEVCNREEILEKYQLKMQKCDKNICLALPEKLIFSEDDLKEYGAMLQIENQNEEIIKNEELKKALTKRRRKLEDKIRNKYLRKFTNLKNFSFIFGQGEIKNDIRQEINLYRELLYNYYTSFPTEIKVENFNSRSALTDIVKIFMKGGRGEISKGDTSQGGKQISMTLEPLDLVNKITKVGGYTVELKAPTLAVSEKSKKIMDIIETPEEIIELNKKYEMLKLAPYGLTNPLIELYLYVANKIGKITIYPKNSMKIITLDGTSLKIISEKVEDYRVEINKDEEIPSEIGDIWLKLNELRIVSSSQATKFKRYIRNEFTVFTTLASEIKTIKNNLKDREERLKNKDVKTGKLKSIINKMELIEKKIKPDEFYELVVTLPEVFKKENFNENLKEMGEFCNKFRKLTNSEITTFEKAQENYKDLKLKITDLKTHSDLKVTLIEIENDINTYRDNYLDIELLHKLCEKINSLLITYNNEFKIRHDKFYEKYDILKNELMKKSMFKIECLNVLKEINFKNVLSVDNFLKEILDSKKCNVIIHDGKITECLDCNYNEIKKIKTFDVIEEEFRNYERRIAGIFEAYLDELNSKFLREKFEFDDDYKMLLLKINNIETNNSIDEDLKKIKEIIQKLKLKFNSILNENNNKTLESKKIKLQEIEEKLLIELQAFGQRTVSLDEVKGKLFEIIEEYKKNDIELAEI